MAFELIDLELEELSLVDRPANAEAKVSLFKRDNPQEDNMEELQQEIETLKGEIETLKADSEKNEAERQRLTKALIDNGFTIETDKIEKRAPTEEIEVEGVMVNKADLPEVVVKALEAAQVEKAEIALEKRAKEVLPNFDIVVAKSLMKAFDGNEAVVQALKAADKVFASKMEEVGEAGAQGDMVSAQDKFDNLVKAHKAEHNVTYEKAYAEVAKTAEGKTLIKEIYKKD